MADSVSCLWQQQRHGVCVKLALALMALGSATACTQSAAPGDGVYQAYNSSGTVEVPPYTRSIFSSTNF